MLIFFLREKKKEFLFFFVREKERMNKNNQEGVLDYSFHKRIWDNLGVHTPVIQETENRQEDRSLGLIMASIEERCRLHASRGISITLYIEIKFWTDICAVIFLWHVCVVMPSKMFIWFFFYIILLRSSHTSCGLTGLSSHHDYLNIILYDFDDFDKEYDMDVVATELLGTNSKWPAKWCAKSFRGSFTTHKRTNHFIKSG